MTSGQGILDPCDSAELVRMLAGVAAEHGADAHRLTREAGVPDWALAPGRVMVPTRLAVRLFELTERTLDLPDLGLILPRMHTHSPLLHINPCVTRSPMSRACSASSSSMRSTSRSRSAPR